MIAKVRITKHRWELMQGVIVIGPQELDQDQDQGREDIQEDDQHRGRHLGRLSRRHQLDAGDQGHQHQERGSVNESKMTE